ncbi:Methyl-accepting chemotaxis protein (MCP) signaling domain protein [Caprobacter fermentans]|uniref:Methyl-accepting chemotaxis protein (MCP) signaling domain protein n=2 Tax=Caproicibacter fermentans TaxID=2576756 RepID=A0A6N8I409_9FIRM|nr:Methyl-accepting chemotaxis protein (MCP) signaling domain protein [Caproicibacter fermentans]
MLKLSHKPGSTKKSIKRTLLIQLIGFAALISILCGVVNSIILYQTATDNMQKRISESATAYNHSVQNAISTYKAEIESIAADPIITDMSKTDQERENQRNALAKKYGFDSIVVTDAAGNTSNGAHVAQREYFQQAMAGNTYFSSTLVGSVTKKTELIIATKADNGQYNGVVYGMLLSDIFSKMISDVSIGQTGYGFMVDKDGKVIAHKDQSVVTKFTNYIDMAKKDGAYSSAASAVRNMIQGKSGTQSFQLEGNDLTLSYQPIPDTDGWSIGVVAKTSEMLQNFYISIFITLILMILFILLSIFMALRIANPLVTPIISLAHRVEQLADGDLHSEVPQVDAQNEIGVLSTSFRSTVQTLNDYIEEISQVLNHLERGDCTVTAVREYQGDFIQIKNSLQNIVSNQNIIFGKIRLSSEQVANGASQISDAAQSLAQGATEQASSIEQLSASITEVNTKVNHNADNAATANEFSMKASAEIEQGNQQMQHMVDAMSEIDESSSQIQQIIKAIEDIAFQTNILALNAAVEAARAGSAGKGFAVVAEEVRNLASKSADAAKNTSNLIAASLTSVGKGKEIADKTAKSFGLITELVEKVGELVNHISSESNEQAASIHQIMLGIDQISAVVQTNSASSEESAATSEELSGQAQELKNTLAAIKLKDSSNN